MSARVVDRCRYRCDRCKCWFDAVADFRMPDVYVPSRSGFPILWNDAASRSVGTMPDHQPHCGGTILREEPPSCG